MAPPTLSSIPSLVGLSLLLIIFSNLVRRWISRPNSFPYPPGPKPRTFIGNLRDIPTAKPWATYSEWAEKYGSVVHIQAYFQHIVIVNSLKDAIELFEKRAQIYSDRPIAPMINLMGWDYNTGLLPYADEWRRHRKLFQQNFNKDACLKYRPIQTRKVNDMLRSLLNKPEDFIMHYKTVAAAIIMAATYGHDVSADNDYFVSLSEQAVKKLVESVFPGAVLVNALPFLRHLPSWFPGTGFKRFAKEAKRLTNNMQDVPFNFVKENMALGIDTEALTAKLLENNIANGGSKEGEDDVKHVAATSYAAGADTTVSSLGTFFYAMARDPRIQAKAQKEIDAVIGIHRLPNYDDRTSLPYVEALYREVMRWRPVAPLGVARATTEDDIYQGFFIPKGTIIYSNIWAMSHDTTVYKNPELFYPERYIEEDGKLNNDDLILAYGFGRRICAGRYMASATVWLAMVSILATFNITPAKDEQGNEIPILGEYTDGMVSHPLPFRCSITPRSRQAQTLITETVENN